MRPVNRTGEVYGKLTVTHKAPSKGGHTYWNCKCECGRAVTVASSNLKNTLSCGCGKEDYLEKGKWEEITMRPHGHFTPWAFIPKSRRADKSIGRNGYWLGRCTRCRTWMRATSTQIKTGKVRGCDRCSAVYWAKRTKEEYLWLGEAVRNTDTKNIWYLMRRRCADLTDAHYGGKGIRVCDRWSGKDGYRNFVADMGLRPHKGLSIERIDNDGDYTPENCIWADIRTQSRNKSTSRKFLVLGQTLNQCDLAAILGTSDKNLSRRIERFRKDGQTQEQIEERLSVELHTVQSTPTHHQLKGLAA